MDIVAEIVSSCMSCFCESGFVQQPVEKWCTYMICPWKELGKLRRQKEYLIALETDVKKMVRIAEHREGKTRTCETKTWLDRVTRVIGETDMIETKAEAANQCQPYCCSRPKLGGRISKLMKEMNELIEKGRQFSVESVAIRPVEIGIKLPTKKVVGETTALRSLEMVWDCLANDEIMIIGVYGKSGVGKSAITKEINNRLVEQADRFNKIIWVTVSQNAEFYQLQLDIGAALDLNLSGEQDGTKRGGLLLKELKQQDKFVLILDNMSKAFPLHDIGIPQPSKENGCKLLLTTTSQEVCKMMGCQKNSIIKVEALSNDEAWELFTVEFGMALAPDVENVAREVVAECACMPPAIIKVCGAMRGNDDIREWRVALCDIRNSIKGQ